MRAAAPLCLCLSPPLTGPVLRVTCSVLGMAALLLDSPLSEDQREFASTIRSSGEALLGIINDILDYSKIEAGKMQLEEVPLDLRDCIEDSLDLVTQQAVHKGLELVYHIHDSVKHTAPAAVHTLGASLWACCLGVDTLLARYLFIAPCRRPA